MQGICEEASAHDYDVMLVTTSANSSANLERMIANNKMDGVILSRSMIEDRNVYLLKEHNIPFVLMGTSGDKNILQVDNDHKSGCREMISRMLDSGLRKIGLIGGSKNYVVNRTRMRGYQEAFARARQELDETLVFEDCDSPARIQDAVDCLIRARAECIVCMDDVVCLSVLQILAKKDIAVPHQIQVASFYDSALLKNNKPAITSLGFDDKALGALTCKTLLDYIGGKEVQGKTRVDYELVTRASTLFKGAGAGGMEDEYAEEEKEDCGIPVL